MPQDIFISYSSKDKEKADQLSDLLTSAGLSVWIDRSGIVGAEHWATEIVDGIKGCSTFILLLSSNSVESENVLRELSLASEKRKRVLPVDLEPIILPSSFEYPLAGLQHVAITDFDKIIHAHKHGVEKVIKRDNRKSLMILPFEDLSPTGDNGWFADGIVSELISALSNVKSIRIADNQATKEFKKFNGLLTMYAREMQIRYFVQGDVRKFGEQIKISSRLIDIETGDHLWQDSIKGTMENIFDFQEEVALKVVEGLKVHLASDEMKKLMERGTENPEAYELFLKGNEYFARQTKEGLQLAVQLWTEAIKLDPKYAQAYSTKANALATLYRSYDRNPKLLEEGLTLIQAARLMKPDLWSLNHPLSVILALQGKLDEAELATQDYILNAPQDFLSHGSLGFFYANAGQYAKAIPCFEDSVKLRPDYLTGLINLVIACDAAKEETKRKQWASVAIPKVEKHLKLFPDDETQRVNQALFLHFADRDEEAKATARKLSNLRDGNSLYIIASLLCKLKEYDTGLALFKKSIETGFRNIPHLKSFLDDEEGVIGKMYGTPEWEEMKRMVARIEVEAANSG